MRLNYLSFFYQFADVFAFLVLSAAGLAIMFGMMGDHQHGARRVHHVRRLCDGRTACQPACRCRWPSLAGASPAV